MKVIVTGASGFLGTNLLRNLKTQGHEIIAYNSKNLNITKKVEFPRDADVVFHLAANSKVYIGKRDPLIDFEINCLGTLNVLEAMRKAGIPKIIYSSSVLVYQDLENTKETDQVGYNKEAGPYGTSKLISEYYIKHFFEMYGINYNILRITGPYGPGMSKNVIYDIIKGFLQRKKQLKLYIGSKSLHDYIYIDDVVKVLTMAVGWENQILNVSNNVSVTPLDIYGKISNIFNREIPKLKFSGKDIKIICDNSKMLSLGGSPEYDIDRGLENTVRYFKTKLR